MGQLEIYDQMSTLNESLELLIILVIILIIIVPVIVLGSKYGKCNWSMLQWENSLEIDLDWMSNECNVYVLVRSNDVNWHESL